ncbi:RES family NAD+ phosphorylase [Mycobacterium sp. SMC-4]|uniref:RES family NAD+ phosphorylase n=1 Tax=Mycobacterium sp. SMC-4 TaxID=2857059 RepID=UPI0028C3B924|nr:RES family NAD+ phosphorylase [Mycobacterium sp. SMC-4]
MWRVEAARPSEWDWHGFPAPRYRFDAPSGAFRTRYAGADLVGAFRERYRATGLVLPADHSEHFLIEMITRHPIRVLDLRTERNLDALDIDDQISTGQHDAVWDTCQRLAEASRQWWPDLSAIVYRSRTTPQQSTNYAFFAHHHFRTRVWRLVDRADVLTELVLRHRFTLNWQLNG